jgi:8-oxo-dGTP pyrophosphatase MutT (NUDIX family)
MKRTRASALCFSNQQWLCVHLKDPLNGRVFVLPPGGEIEPGEAPVDAAQREALEETGYVVKVDPSTELIVDYPFLWAGKTYDCRTHFFIARLQGDWRVAPRPSPPPERESYILKSEWLTTEQLYAALDFHPQLKPLLKSWIEKNH